MLYGDNASLDSRFVFVPRTDAERNRDDIRPEFTPGDRRGGIRLDKELTRPSSRIGGTLRGKHVRGKDFCVGASWWGSEMKKKVKIIFKIEHLNRDFVSWDDT